MDEPLSSRAESACTKQNQFDLSTSTTKVLAIGNLNRKGNTSSDWQNIILKEVSATVRLYLHGKIEQWFARTDQSGVVFLLSLDNVPDAVRLINDLPLVAHEMMEFELIALGPYSPLRFLLPRTFT